MTYLMFYTGSSSYRYFLRDYQGNVRVVADTQGGILQRINYYPYGTPWNDNAATAGYQAHKYGCKELDLMHGLNLYDFGAREYDPALGLFTSMDPLCEKYYHISPYAYCAGNPVRYRDPSGMDWYQNTETQYYTWFSGNSEHIGYTYIGEKGSVLGEFEDMIDNVLRNTFDREGLYIEGFTFDIAPIDKGGLIGSRDRGWDLFDEFINGTGPEYSVFLDEHPYTQVLMQRPTIVSAQKRINNNKKTYYTTEKFYPWKASLNSPMQFIGSYRYDGLVSKNGKEINNLVTDTKSCTSLFYHFGFLGNHDRSDKKELGTTFQFYIWKSVK